MFRFLLRRASPYCCRVRKGAGSTISSLARTNTRLDLGDVISYRFRATLSKRAFSRQNGIHGKNRYFSSSSNHGPANPVVLGNAAALTIGSLIIYFGPFPRSREGLFVAYHYPFQMRKEDSPEVLFFKTVVILSGLGAVFVGVQRVRMLTALTDMSRNLVALVCGVFTSMVIIDQSDRIVFMGMRGSKMLDYLLDGLACDLFDGACPRSPIWERRDDISSEQIEQLHEHSRNQSNINPTRPTVNVQSMNLTQVRAALANGPPQNKDWTADEQNEILERHQELLIDELIALRREESDLRLHLKFELERIPHSASNHFLETKQRLEAIGHSKAHLKAESLQFHGQPGLAKRADASLIRLINHLTELRLRQKILASGDPTGSRALVIESEIRALDEEKAKLKREARERFGEVISRQAEKVTPWRQVWKK